MPQISAADRQRVLSVLKNIEEQHQVKLLLAVDAGSRALNLDCEASDHDIRIVYLHHPDWYLRIDAENLKREIIEKTQDLPEIDVHGYDLQKFLTMLRKSNPVLLEWLSSSIVYVADDTTVAALRALAQRYHKRAVLAMNFVQVARTNWVDYIRNKSEVNRKKYLYIIRSLMMAQYVLQIQQESDTAFPPLNFDELWSAVKPVEAIPENIRNLIDELVTRKRATCGQWPKEPAIPELEVWMTDYRKKLDEQARELERIAKQDRLANGLAEIPFDDLNDMFISTVKRWSDIAQL